MSPRVQILSFLGNTWQKKLVNTLTLVVGTPSGKSWNPYWLQIKWEINIEDYTLKKNLDIYKEISLWRDLKFYFKYKRIQHFIIYILSEQNYWLKNMLQLNFIFVNYLCLNDIWNFNPFVMIWIIRTFNHWSCILLQDSNIRTI